MPQQSQTLPINQIPTHSHGYSGGIVASGGLTGTSGMVNTTSGWVTVGDVYVVGGNPTRTPTPSPLPGRNGKPAFMLHPDGRIDADWRELMAMKDEFLAGNAPQHAWAAALWLARNTR